MKTMPTALKSLLPALLTGLLCLCLCGAVSADNGLEGGFQKPPAAARPWVYWFWLNGNITREGITADLEAMKRVGIGGVLIMEVDQGAPVGPVDFMGPQWRELFKHVVAEARRLGLEVNMNNDAGWNGSGGPWIKPEQSMQKVVWTETDVDGPAAFRRRAAAAGGRGRLLSRHRRAGVSRRRARTASTSIQAKAAYEVGGVGPAAEDELAAGDGDRPRPDRRPDRADGQRRPAGVGRAGRASGRCCASATRARARRTRPRRRAAAGWNATS